MSERQIAILRATVILWCTACAGSCKQSTEAVSPAPQTRTYRMGFSGVPPSQDFNLAINAILMASQRSDAAIFSNEPPWDSLLAGISPESLVVRNELGLAEYYRSRNFALWVYCDPGNGLNRGGESDGLLRHGRSITDPAIQGLYRRYVVVLDSILRPEHLGVALETNLIRGASTAVLYDAIRQVANDAAADVRARNGGVKLSVSVQVDYAWGCFGGSYQGVNTDFADFPFIQELGLSSYPYLAGFAEPEDIPVNYYTRLVEGRTIPVMVTEGGWTSASLGTGVVSSPGEQRRYIVRQAELLDAASAIAVFQLTFTDIALGSFSPSLRTSLTPFAYLGLEDTTLVPKPALAAWDSTFARARMSS